MFLPACTEGGRGRSPCRSSPPRAWVEAEEGEAPGLMWKRGAAVMDAGGLAEHIILHHSVYLVICLRQSEPEAGVFSNISYFRCHSALHRFFGGVVHSLPIY